MPLNQIAALANLATLKNSGAAPGAIDPRGLLSCFVLHDGTLHEVTHDNAGRVDGFKPWPFLQPWQFLPVAKGIPAPAIGEPYKLGFLPDADRPEDVIITPWPKMAECLVQLLRHGSEFRTWVNNSGISGYYAAHFLGSKVPRHVAAGAMDFDLISMKEDIREMAYLTKALATANPQWVTKQTVTPPLQGPGLKSP